MKVVIVHGCPNNLEKERDPEKRIYDKNWRPWLKEKLEEKEIKVYTPLMPEPWAPIYENWKKEFDKLEFDEDSVLIGHSCGCAFLVRWLGETKRKIKKLILVAPWKITDKERYEGKEVFEIREKFYNYSIKDSVKLQIGEVIFFTADDEELDGKKSLEIYRESLGGKIIELSGRGHYTQGDMGTNEFPELLEEVLKTK